MLAYLTAENAHIKLTQALAGGTVPSVEALSLALENIEVRIDGWLGYRAAPTCYVEKLTTNADGIALLRNYPVIAVEEVALFGDATPGYDPTPITADRLRSV